MDGREDPAWIVTIRSHKWNIIQQQRGGRIYIEGLNLQGSYETNLNPVTVT